MALKNIGQMIVTPRQYQEGWFEFKYDFNSGDRMPEFIRHPYTGGELLEDGNYLVPVMRVIKEEKLNG